MPLPRRIALAAVTLSLAVTGTALAASPAAPKVAAHHPHFLGLFGAGHQAPTNTAIVPPAPPCPLPGIGLPTVQIPVLGGSTPNSYGPCVMLPVVPPPAGQPWLGNMAYWGGRVQVHPHVYLIFFGWGQSGAFKSECGAPVKLVEGRIRATLKCDPDGAGKRMADFVSQLGGTKWAGVQSQYYQIVNGVKSYISNDASQLAGIWTDDTNKTSAKISQRDMAVEVVRAVHHFKVAQKELWDSNFVVVQPQNFSDPRAAAQGYCAFHDLIRADVDPTDYHGLPYDIPWTNMPYVLNNGTGCGENLVNPGAAGKLDGFTVALGHEIEETTTDPGAEDVIQNTPIGGWYDPFDGYENGDKCAYVGSSPFGGSVNGIAGRSGNIIGNRGGSFPVQSLWSNNAAGGVGYCAGAGTDLPF